MRFLNKNYGNVYQNEAGEEGDGGSGGDVDISGGDTDSGNAMDSFFNAVSDEGLRNEALSMFTEKTPDDFIKTAINSQKMIGNSIRIPGEDADEGALDKFYGKLQGVKGVIVAKDDQALRASLGVPDDPSAYEVDLSGLPEDIQIEQSELDAKRQYWHKLGLSPSQVKVATEEWIQQEIADDAEWKKASVDAEKALKAEFGAAFDEKMELVKFVAGNVMDQDDFQYLKASGALMRPGVIKAFAKLGESLQEDGTIEAARRSTTNYTPNEARERIAEIQANPAYWDSSKPEHKDLVAKAQRLYAMANSG